MTPFDTIDLREDPDADFSSVVAHLRAGGLIAYPTETVYGLGGGCGIAPVASLRAAKGRQSTKPFIVLVESADEVERLAWTAEAETLASIFWPGSVTLILADPQETFPPGIRSEAGAVAVRVSPHPIVARLLKAYAAPLTSTSLNEPGMSPAQSSEAARDALRGLGIDDVVLLDAGTLPPSGPSTVIDCTAEKSIVVREGVVPTGRLRCAIPEIHG